MEISEKDGASVWVCCGFFFVYAFFYALFFCAFFLFARFFFFHASLVQQV
jgi:hypothetical protein